MRKVKSEQPRSLTDTEFKEALIKILDTLHCRFGAVHKIGILGAIGVDLLFPVQIFTRATPAIEILNQMSQLIGETLAYIESFDPTGKRELPEDAAPGTDKYRIMRASYDISRLGIFSIHSDSSNRSSENFDQASFITMPSLIETIRKAYTQYDALPLVDEYENRSPAVKKIMESRREFVRQRLWKERLEQKWDDDKKRDAEILRSFLEKNPEAKRISDMLLKLSEHDGGEEMPPSSPEPPTSGKTDKISGIESIINTLKEYDFKISKEGNADGSDKIELSPFVEKNPEDMDGAIALYDILRNKFCYTGNIDFKSDDHSHNLIEIHNTMMVVRHKVRTLLQANPRWKLLNALELGRPGSR